MALAKAHAGAGLAARKAGVLKGRDPYFDRISTQFFDDLSKAQMQIAQERLDAIRQGASQGPLWFGRQVEVLVQEIRDGLWPEVEESAADALLMSYTRGMVDMIGTTRFDFNAADERALAWLSSDTRYWVGSYWSPELAAKIGQDFAAVFQQGLSMSQMGQLAADTLGGQFSRSEAYWRMFTTNVVTRSRNFATAEGAVRAGFRVGRYDAIIDGTTSDFCRAIDEREVLVADMVGQRDAIIGAGNPEAIRDVAPWPRPEEVAGIIQQAEALGTMPQRYAMPPFHGSCRTVIVFT